MDDALLEEGENNKDAEVAPALISIHPLDKFITVAVGCELRLYDLDADRPISLIDDSGGPSHSDTIRIISFGAKGRLFVSAGDDKLVKIWTTSSWHCIRTVHAEKRVSAAVISHDGRFVVFADKFGVVWLTVVDEDSARQANLDNKPVAILGHYCSIITSLKFSPDGRFLTSADRDFKIRVTIFPKEPLQGAHEIQSFCLGHTDFISCLAFACHSDFSEHFLISGSGDSTVRLWDFISGNLLDTCQVGAKVELSHSNGAEKQKNPAVTDLCVALDGSLIVVATQSLHGVMILKCDFTSKTLSIVKVVTLGESYSPTSLALSSSTNYLWTVMGASDSHTSTSTQLFTCIKVASCSHKDGSSDDLVVLEDSKVPGGENLVSTLQGSLDCAKDEAALAATAAMLKVSMHNLLIKKQYPFEQREVRKRNRNDRKNK